MILNSLNTKGTFQLTVASFKNKLLDAYTYDSKGIIPAAKIKKCFCNFFPKNVHQKKPALILMINKI